ncbi:MAG: hypothetical protein O2990_02665 [Bacteroidetes bacterium]|nr:hypothetical protein [Bacteroidota bacterium]
MRWVNHHTHPGDTRYHVFVFRELHHAERFEERCNAAGIPFERHEEGGEVMFGIAKNHFKTALHANHMVHAEFRSPFIPDRGWRWGLLMFTGAVVALALLGWLTSTTALGQVESGLPWELDVVSRIHVPSDALGMEPTVVIGQGVSATWIPKVGTEFGLRIHRRLKEGWTLGGGVEWVRREHALVVGYVNDTIGVATSDTLPQMRSLAYRIPVLGGIRVPIGFNDLEIQASGGLGLEWKTSETVVSQLVQTAGADHIVQAYQGRTSYVTVPILAEVGLQRRASGDRPGWYVGWYWSSPLGRDAWAENTWTSGSTSGLARNWLNLVVTGLDVRLVLPE